MENKLFAPNFHEADELLNDFLQEVKHWEGTLADGESILGPGATAITELKKSQINFGNPRDKLTLLTEATFKEFGTDLNSIYRQQMQDQYDFYYLTLQVALIPGRTVQFWKLVCELDFGPKGEQEPILQSIFPNEKWRSVLKVEGGVDIGLIGLLGWIVGVDTSALEVIRAQMPGELQVDITNKSDFKAVVTMPAYKYEFGYAEILATGVGATARWNIKDKALKKTGMVEFATVFKVPKSVQELELTGTVWAEPNTNWLFSDVRDVAGELSDRFKQLFRNQEEASRRLVRGVTKDWLLELPKAASV